MYKLIATVIVLLLCFSGLVIADLQQTEMKSGETCNLSLILPVYSTRAVWSSSCKFLVEKIYLNNVETNYQTQSAGHANVGSELMKSIWINPSVTSGAVMEIHFSFKANQPGEYKLMFRQDKTYIAEFHFKVSKK